MLILADRRQPGWVGCSNSSFPVISRANSECQTRNRFCKTEPYSKITEPLRTMSTTYKDSGVNLELYEESMRRLPKWMHRTFSPRVVATKGALLGFSPSIFAVHSSPEDTKSGAGFGNRWSRHQTEGSSTRGRHARLGSIWWPCVSMMSFALAPSPCSFWTMLRCRETTRRC